MATIEKRGNSYRITVSAGYSTDGKQIKKRMTWKPEKGMTARQIKKELDKQAVLFERQVETGQFLDGSVTLAEFIEKWFTDYAEGHLKEKSLTGYKDLLPRILQAIGHIKLCKLQPHHLMEFYGNLSEAGVRRDIKYKPPENFKELIKAAAMTQKALSERSGVSLTTIKSCIDGHNVTKETADKLSAALSLDGAFEPQNADGTLSGSTVAKYHRLLSSILTAAVRWQVIPSNPCQRVEPPKQESAEVEVLDENGVSQLIECLNSEPLKYRTAIMFILYTGMRRGELMGLAWDDIDLDRGIISVRKALLYTPNKGVYEDTPKTKKSDRVINIPDDMTRLLSAYAAEQAAVKLKMGDLWHESGKVFTSDTGEVMHPDSFSSWFKRFVRRDIHIHTLRHVSATLLILGGTDIATVSGRLGHANRTTTLNIYTHAVQQADAMAAEKLQDMLTPSRRWKAI